MPNPSLLYLMDTINFMVLVNFQIACSRRSDSVEQCEVKEREKIKAREEERSLSTFHRFLYFAPLSTI